MADTIKNGRNCFAFSSADARSLRTIVVHVDIRSENEKKKKIK